MCAPMARAFFITLEGGEGAGKSTQAALLASRLNDHGLDVVSTREPGGSPGAESIRALLVTGAQDRWSPVTETLLMYAARRDHIERLIRPALKRNATVICDRFIDSTRAYQGVAGGVPAGLIDALETLTLDGVWPDLTLIFDLPPEIGLARAASRGTKDVRFETKDVEFHGRLRDGFLEIARREPDRCAIVDASLAPDAVAELVWSIVEPRLPAR